MASGMANILFRDSLILLDVNFVLFLQNLVDYHVAKGKCWNN